MNPWMLAIVQILAAAIGGTGLLKLVEAFMGRRKGNADAAAVLADSVTDWSRELKQEAKEARERADQEAKEARERAEALNTALDTSANRVRSLSYELDMAFAKLKRWKTAIKDPGIGRDQLIAMVEFDYPTNETNNGGHQ